MYTVELMMALIAIYLFVLRLRLHNSYSTNVPARVCTSKYWVFGSV